MPRINANRDSVDDRFSVLGFTVRTESPLYEIAVATDPALFRADARSRRARRNFFSSRAQGALRARRGEAVYLLPQDVLANFVGSPKLYFGLATYREGSTAKPDFVQLPSEGNMYVGLGGLTERGLRRAVSPLSPTSYGTTPGRDPSLDWGGDSMAPPAAATPAAAANGAAARPNGAAAAPAQAPATAAALDYDDGFGAFPPPADPHAGTAVAAQEVLLRAYDGDLASQLRLFAETAMWVAGVGDTTRFPHSAICQVEIWNGDRPVGNATAFYVGRRVLLTNAHVVRGATRLVVIPGKNGAGRSRAEEPFGRFTCTDWRAHERYVHHNHDFDMAVVHATQDAPGGKWLTPIEELRQTRPEGVAVCGYSAESRREDLAGTVINSTLDADKQHVHRGFVRTLQDERFQYDVQELAGSSGSPVYWIENGTPPRAHVVGINAGPFDNVTNEGCRLTDAKVAWIRARAAEWHESAAMALDGESADDTPVQAQEVPLAPAAGGGRSISTAALQPGDIILETANAVVSYAIRAGTMSAASHVMLYAGNGRIIDAVGSGVRDVTIEEGLGHAMLAVAFRHPRMTPEIAQRIVAFARAQAVAGVPYNYAGVAGAGVRLLAPFPAAIVDGIARRLHREVGQAGAVYCSELVMDAYARNGLPLTSVDPARSTPQDVVSFATANLQYVGHLIAEDTGWLGAQLHFPTRMLSVDEDADTPVTAQELIEQSYDGTLEAQIRLFAQSVEWIAGVPNTRGFPHSAICWVGDIQRGPEAEFGTAFFIGKHLLLTAGHVVDGMARLVFAPGKNGLGTDAAHEPFGRFELALTSANCFKYPGFVAASGTDMALIYTGPAHSAPNDRWFNIVEELRQSRPEGVGVCGYSVSSSHAGWLPQLVNTLNDPRKQHLHRGYVRTLPGNDLFTYDVQTLPGASGSPVYWVEAGSPPRVHCVGVHIAGDSATTNRGCRMTDAKVAWLRAKAAAFGEAHAFALGDGDGDDGGYPQAASAEPASDAPAGARRPRLAPPPAPVMQQPLGIDEPAPAPASETASIASTVAGATMQRVTQRSPGAELRLEQLQGLKHPGDHPPAQPRPLHDGTPVRLADWPRIDGAAGGVTAAPVEIRWQYDGVSLGNVRVSASPMVAAGAGLRVAARILDDAAVYPRTAPAFAALHVRLDYAFEHGGHHPVRAFQDVQLFGNGRCNVAGDWHRPEHHEPGAEASALQVGSGSGSGAAPVAPPSLTLSWEAGNPARATWTRELVAAVVAHKAQLDRGNPEAFIPGYAALSADLQVKFWAELFVAIAKWESGWNPADSYMETNGEASVGLLALSYTDADSYPVQGLDRAHDTLKDAVVNLRAGVVILATLVGRDGAVTGSTAGAQGTGWKGAARYWSTMRTERKHLADIRQRVQDAVGIHR